MDIATLIGLVGAIGTIIMAIVIGGSAGMFVNIPSLIIVFGGTLMVTMMRSSMADFVGAVGVAGRSFGNPIEKPEALIEKFVEYAELVRKDGMIALESKVGEEKNEFLKRGLEMLVDGKDKGYVSTQLTKDTEIMVIRHERGADIWSSIGDFGPAMGMIGTLVGLVQMLANMSDPKSIGPAMAVALLTTLYGAFLANVIAFPIQQKLKQRMVDETLNNELILTALNFMQDGGNPRVLSDKLSIYLDPATRAKMANA
jgi:chemotaxis protein MotA